MKRCDKCGTRMKKKSVKKDRKGLLFNKVTTYKHRCSCYTTEPSYGYPIAKESGVLVLKRS